MNTNKWSETKRKIVKSGTDGEDYYDSINQVKIYGFDPCHVVKCCKGQRKTHWGYTCSYVIVLIFLMFSCSDNSINGPEYTAKETVIDSVYVCDVKDEKTGDYTCRIKDVK